jgi:hypothetical protein
MNEMSSLLTPSCSWVAVIAKEASGQSMPMEFIHIGDDAAWIQLLSRHSGRFLYRLVANYSSQDIVSRCATPLYVTISHPHVDMLRRCVLATCHYIAEHCQIPEDRVEIIHTGTGQIYIVVLPEVFAGEHQLSDLMPRVNYALARTLFKHCSTTIDIDVYHHNYLIPLANTLNPATGRYVISLSLNEFLNLDTVVITELAQQPRPEYSMVIPYTSSSATRWFAEVLAETLQSANLQARLRIAFLKSGWQILPCIARLSRNTYQGNAALEAARITAQFIAWIGAAQEEVRRQITGMHCSESFASPQKIAAIVAFAVENPGFSGCEHPLLKAICRHKMCPMPLLKKRLRQQPLLPQNLAFETSSASSRDSQAATTYRTDRNSIGP